MSQYDKTTVEMVAEMRAWGWTVELRDGEPKIRTNGKPGPVDFESYRNRLTHRKSQIEAYLRHAAGLPEATIDITSDPEPRPEPEPVRALATVAPEPAGDRASKAGKMPFAGVECDVYVVPPNTKGLGIRGFISVSTGTPARDAHYDRVFSRFLNEFTLGTVPSRHPNLGQKLTIVPTKECVRVWQWYAMAFVSGRLGDPAIDADTNGKTKERWFADQALGRRCAEIMFALGGEGLDMKVDKALGIGRDAASEARALFEAQCKLYLLHAPWVPPEPTRGRMRSRLNQAWNQTLG
jgi:hypothetical protein